MNFIHKLRKSHFPRFDFVQIEPVHFKFLRMNFENKFTHPDLSDGAVDRFVRLLHHLQLVASGCGHIQVYSRSWVQLGTWSIFLIRIELWIGRYDRLYQLFRFCQVQQFAVTETW